MLDSNIPDIIRTVISVLLFAFFLWLAGINLYIFWQGFFKKKETASWAPFLGGVCGVIAVLMFPYPAIKKMVLGSIDFGYWQFSIDDSCDNMAHSSSQKANKYFKEKRQER